jgi:MFS superfamily sulfate permease-like transporter
VNPLPGLALLRSQRGPELRRDAIAGIVLAALLIPQGMGYAAVAGLPPVTGLYATLVPLLVYFLLGPSRILVLGPDSAICPLVAAAIVPLAAHDFSERIALAGLLALGVGAIMLAGGLARFGFVTELLSMPVRLGYLMGIAVTVIVAVLGLLWGIGVAIALSLLNFIRRAWYPHDAVLARVDDLKGYHDTTGTAASSPASS